MLVPLTHMEKGFSIKPEQAKLTCCIIERHTVDSPYGPAVSPAVALDLALDSLLAQSGMPAERRLFTLRSVQVDVDEFVERWEAGEAKDCSIQIVDGLYLLISSWGNPIDLRDGSPAETYPPHPVVSLAFSLNGLAARLAPWVVAEEGDSEEEKDAWGLP